MSGPDSPNFEWLKRELGEELAGATGSDSSTSLADPPDEPVVSEISETAPPDQEVVDSTSIADEQMPSPAEESALEDTSAPEEAALNPELSTVPDPVMNDSDGTTVIIPNRKFTPANPPPATPPVNPFAALEAPAAAEPASGFPLNLVVNESFARKPKGAEKPAKPAKAAEQAPPAVNPEPEPPGQPPVNTSLTDTIPVFVEPQGTAPIWQSPAAESPGFSKVPPPGEVSPTEESAEATIQHEDSPNEPPATAIFHSHQLPAAAESVDAVAEVPNETALDEAAEPAPALADSGHTEVLKPEDLAKAKDSWTDLQVPAATAATSPAAKGRKPKPAPKAAPVAEVGSVMPSRSFILLASYASVVTLLLIAWLLRSGSVNPHQLESLPDIATQKVEELTYIPPNAKLPPGHTLALGEQQRFGNILVEPLAITQAPVEFLHYSGDANRKRPATRPVWLLKVRLTNVSKDQAIAPLDRNLVLRWVTNSNLATEFSNYFIAPRGTRDRNAPQVQLYRLPVSSDWDMVGQDLGKTLQPGESYETYLASAEEGLNDLPENLVWRVQIRKGYSKQGNGVTTIFQVPFRKSQVVGATS